MEKYLWGHKHLDTSFHHTYLKKVDSNPIVSTLPLRGQISIGFVWNVLDRTQLIGESNLGFVFLEKSDLGIYS